MGKDLKATLLETDKIKNFSFNYLNMFDSNHNCFYMSNVSGFIKRLGSYICIGLMTHPVCLKSYKQMTTVNRRGDGF